ncbi:MAG: 3'(2'),5'-bisphosphate nucleotidase CysQ [Alphaproteobacteria bacterium GM202ARS2]|nr:3'(2'),5'-bisphosphate nucleotidase CysQ [Alphaproteobacteria bacterium GM202ARS2]
MDKALLGQLGALAIDVGAFLVHRRGSGESLNIRSKDDKTPVTDGDVEAERRITDALATLTPQIAVVGEEAVSDGGLSAVPSRFWLVDAVDGTRSYMKGGDEFTVNIGLIEDGIPTAGIVCAPSLDGGRCFMGAQGIGAFVCSTAQGTDAMQAIRVSSEEGAILVSRLHETDSTLKAFLAKHPCRKVGSSVKFCLVACGEASSYPRFSPTREWDTAAGDAVLRAAGGRTVGADGKPLAYGKAGLHNPSFLACHGEGALYHDLIALLVRS